MPLVIAEAYLHTLDPFAVRFPDSWPIAGLRWYGLAYAAGFLVSWWLLHRMAATGRSVVPLRTPDGGRATAIGDIMTYVIIGILVGGRVGYALFYQPRLFVGFSADFPWWDLLAINKGGMASHGGMIGLILGCWLAARKHGIPALHLFDVGSFACAPGLFLGRLANFVNAELWGRRLPDAMQADPPWWSVEYPEDVLALSGEQLAALTPAVEAIDESSRLWHATIERAATDPEAGRMVDFTLTRVAEAARAGDEAVGAAVRPLLDAYYPSQLFQALTDGPLLMGILALVWLRPRKPGVVGSVFLVAYGLLRILSEVFRQPDEGVAVVLGLSRGQWLSVLMVLSGAIALPIVMRRDVEPIGGLLRRRPEPR
jgi:phosphatidylglycerol:prolipoprotein diacylglycerol transferase